MTCPTCGRRIRAAALTAAIRGDITPEQLTALLGLIDTSKEHAMHAKITHTGTTLTLVESPAMGDIGVEEEETWEVFPDHVPAETPAEVPSEPVPA